MIPKLLGAMLIVSACGAMGLGVASAHRRKEKMLLQMIQALQAMSSELQYRLTPLPQLLRLGAAQCGGSLASAFRSAAEEMEKQLAPDAACCFRMAVESTPEIPNGLRDKLLLLGKGLGRFDLQGQLSAMEAVSALCKRDLDGLLLNRDARLRSYTTLGLCAGVALVILFI